MEGVCQEAASLAGAFGLGKLLVFYDDNRITIDGTTALSFDSEDKCARFAAYGWHVQRVEDVNDVEALDAAVAAAREDTARPSFVAVRSHIAYPAPHAMDTAKAHGAPLGEDEVRAAKEVLGFDPDESFVVPDGVYEHMSRREDGAAARGRLAGALRPLARVRSPSWPRTGTALRPGSCSTAGRRRCRASTRSRRRSWRPARRAPA